jgi:hypothetical protein
MAGRVYDIDISEVTLDPDNANSGTERGRALHQQSLETYGAGRSVALDRNNVPIAGNKTIEVAAELGIPIRVIETDGTELIAVKRIDMDLEDDPEGRARGLAIADNLVGQVNLKWNREALQRQADKRNPAIKMYTPAELKALGVDAKADASATAGAGAGAHLDGERVDRPAEPMPGDTYHLGRHRLHVGGAHLDVVDEILSLWEERTGVAPVRQ